MPLANDIIPQRAISITPSDTVNLTRAVQALSCTGPGNASIVTEGGDVVTIYLGTSQFSVSVSRVNATGTTATGIVGWY